MHASKWDIGCMFVATTRPVPKMHAFDYAEVCKSDRAQREVLGPIESVDVLNLAERYLPKERITMQLIEQLKAASRGFPYLAVELLKDALANPDTCALSKSAPESVSSVNGAVVAGVLEQEQAAAMELYDRLLFSAKESDYTNEEIAFLNNFWETNVKKSSSGDNSWNSLAFVGGVEYFDRADNSSAIRQGKAEGIVTNSTPMEVLSTVVGMIRNTDHPLGSIDNRKTVIEDTNNHSGIVNMHVAFPKPLMNRDLLTRYLWKEMEPGVVLYVNHSVVDSRKPPVPGVVRMHCHFFAYVLRTTEDHSNSVHCTLLCMSDLCGIVPTFVMNAGLQNFLSSVNSLMEYFGKRQGHGVPMLKYLIKKRISQVGLAKILGVLGVAGVSLRGIDHLASMMGYQPQQMQDTLNQLYEHGFLVKGTLLFTHAFVMNVCMNLLSAEDTKSTHQTAMEALIEDYKKDETKSMYLPAIAHHSTRAGSLDNARSYTMLAANAALRNDDNNESDALFKEYLDILEQLQNAAKGALNPLRGFDSIVHEKLHAYVHLGRLNEAEKLASGSSLVPKMLKNK